MSHDHDTVPVWADTPWPDQAPHDQAPHDQAPHDQAPHDQASNDLEPLALCCPECGNNELVETSIATDQGYENVLECDHCGEVYSDAR